MSHKKKSISIIQQNKGDKPCDHPNRCRKSIDKIQQPFILKTNILSKLGIKRNTFCMIRISIIQTTTTKTQLQLTSYLMVKDGFLLRLGIGKECLLITSTQHFTTISFENTGITTNWWTIINRKTLEPTKKDTPQEDTGTHQKRYPTSKDKGEAAMRW